MKALQMEQEEKIKRGEEQRRLQAERRLRELQTEQQKKIREQDQQRLQEERRMREIQAEQEKLKTFETHKKPLPETVEFGQEPSSQKDASLTKNPRDLKKELKEQKRQHQLALRKARIEERQRKKAEKKALKLAEKQAMNLRQKEETLKKEQKTTDESKPFSLIKEKKLGKTEKMENQEKTDEKKHDSPPELDEDIKQVLLITDYLLGELPEDVLNLFLESEEFELYEKVLNKYKIK